jgi:hypothetical protein
MSLPMPSPASLPGHYAVISAMITPAFFLTATASLLSSSNSRLARVVDRMRVDLAAMASLADPAERSLVLSRIIVHKRRSRLVLASLRMLYAAVSAFVGTSLGIAADHLLDYRLGSLPTLFAVIGVLLVLAASVCLGIEARLSLGMLDVELDREITRHQRNATTS